MELTYGQLEAVLNAHLGIHPDRIGTLRSRIKQLQRLQFPPGVNVGRGARMAYDAEHLFMMVTAFELIGAGFPAQPACSLVTDHWDTWAAAYALSAIQSRAWGGEKHEPILVVSKIHALHEIQVGDHGFNAPSEVRIYDRAAYVDTLEPTYQRGFTRTVVAVSAVLDGILEIASKRAGVARSSVYNEVFHAWLPKGSEVSASFKVKYPDRSNIKMRRHLNLIYGNDPDSVTPDGAEEAQEFLRNDYGGDVPF